METVVKAGGGFAEDKPKNSKPAAGLPCGGQQDTQKEDRCDADKLLYNLGDSRDFCFFFSIKIAIDAGGSPAERKKQA